MDRAHLPETASERSLILRHHVVVGILCALVFVADLLMTSINAVGVLYACALYVIGRLGNRSLIWGYAVFCSILILAGAFDLSSFEYSFYPDRFLALVVVWFAAGLLCHFICHLTALPFDRYEERETLLRMAFDSAPNALIMMDGGGIIRQANQAALQLFGYELDDLLGKKIEMLMPDRYSARHVQLRDQYLEKPDKRNMGEGRDLFGICKNGTEIPIEIGLNPVKTKDGIMVISSIVDISNRVNQLNSLRELSGKLALTNSSLEKDNQELDEFAYVASHDLKAPLRGIEQLAYFIEEDAGDMLPPDSREDLSLLRDRIKRLEDLLSSLLEYSRIGRKDGEAGWVDSKKVFENVLDLYVPTDRFRVNLPEDMPAIFAPLAAVELVFRNLFMNIVKHHDKDCGVIDVEIESTDSEVIFTIRDDGPGIPEEYQEKVFQPFQTLKPRDEMEGSGMGLALVKKTMETHHGRVELFSDGKRGTSFSVVWTLPAKSYSE